jgi:sugar lactone lactonase YvrE
LLSWPTFSIRRELLLLAATTVFVAGLAVAQGSESGGSARTPEEQLLIALTQIVAKYPRHVGALYVAARTAASMGDDAKASWWLDRLAEVGMEDELDPDDFGAFVNTPAYRERAARFAAKAPPIGKAERSSELRCGDLLPEGTAWDAKRRELLISSGRRRTVVAIDAQGNCRDLVPQGDGGLFAVLGMVADGATDSLWVASTAAPFMIDVRPEDAGRALLARIDLAQGRVAEVYPLAGPGMLNDLARARDGSLYVTESRGGTIWRLPRGSKSLVRVLPADTLESPNGIVVLDSGELLVADFDGLALIEAPATNSPRVRRLSTPADLYLGGIDGLARSGSGVVAIQNLVGRTRIWSLALDTKAGRVTRAEVLMRGHPDFRNPTTGVVVGDRLLFLADTKLQSATPDGALTPLPAGRTGHRLLEISVGGQR